MSLEDEAFVQASCHLLLDDPPTPEQLEPYILRLRCGESKLSLLADIARQPQARGHMGRLPGLGLGLRKYRLSSLPWVGVLFRWLWQMPGETSAERRLRIIENQIYLLAKHLARSDQGDDLPLAPWAGVGCAEWLSRARERIDGVSPEIRALHDKLVAAARDAVNPRNASPD